ncbi:MAG: Gfo/Idh/MocA family oxidoreductase [Anaerolineae bacterium]|nr:Gfo/Idh/MocA family oxidoreductase [Candidatus Roseilinea sp.]MDW8449935.1 Gfo/Idh/MocA family oxidoreductase [Anaerolineae bacterium]
MTTQVNVGIIGCGNISPVYFRACKSLEILNLVGCADLDMARAEARAREFGTRAFGVEALLAHPDVQIIINLTIPKAHGEIGIAALEAGKSVYNEKPLALSREEARRMLALAEARGLRVGGAPDTFMGAGIQTCRKLIDDGAIGQPIAAAAFMLCHGHESWHPDPEFYYQPGGGPMFDMGPYYLTALVTLIGPVQRVTGSARVTFPERTITSQPKYGQKITVRVPTHVAGVLDFASGAIGTLVTSFDVWKHSMPCIEIYGSEGSLQVPDPNTFGGPVRVARAGEKEWTDVPLTHPYSQQSRGLGVADMAYALQSGRAHRASGELTYHVLDIMHAIHEASAEGRHILLESTCERPTPLPADLREGTLDP